MVPPTYIHKCHAHIWVNGNWIISTAGILLVGKHAAVWKIPTALLETTVTLLGSHDVRATLVLG